MKHAIEMVKAMLLHDEPMEKISKYTGLSVKEIEKIKLSKTDNLK